MPEKRLKAKSRETWEQRFPRYASNAEITAEYAEKEAARHRFSAQMHAKAARNALDHGDGRAAGLYHDMAEAAEDAADALEDLAGYAREIAEHYDRKA